MSNVPKWPPDGGGAEGDRTAKDEREKTAVLSRPPGESASGQPVAPSDAPTLIDVTPGTGHGVTPADAPTMLDAGAVRPPRQAPVTYHHVSAPALPPGTVLGQRYEIVALLGEGGMGAVYEALDRELERPVALKVIRPELAKSKAIIDRFKQELLLAREVTHRNVIRIYDLGEADGIKFITMEFVQGEDLRTLLLREKKLAPEQAVGVIQQICRALEAAHATGIIHRDLKPQNVMCDRSGRLLVMDFGLARMIEGDGMTQTGALVGTMDYMSPEQALAKDLDQRSDIFTVGLIFYELLTGVTPFRADSAIASLLRRTSERAIPVSDHDKTIPAALSGIVSKCLERDPNLRYQSATELLRDLDAWQGKLAGATLGFQPAVEPWGRTIPWPLLCGIVTVIVLALAGYFYRGKLFGPPGQKAAGPAMSLAILPFRNASGDVSLNWMGGTVAEILRTDIGQSESFRTVSSDRLSQILHDLRVAPDASPDPDTLRRIAEFTSADHLLWGQFVKLGDQIRIDATLQDLKRQRDFALKAEATSEKELPKVLQQLAESVGKSLALPPETIKELKAEMLKPSSQSVQALRYYSEGMQMAHQGKNIEAQKSLEAATQEDPKFALAYARLGQSYAHLGHSDQAEQATRKAVALSEPLPQQEKQLIAAIYAQTRNDTHKAIEAYESLAKILPADSDVQIDLAALYSTAGSFDKAREFYSKLLSRDPKDVEALYGIAFVEINVGNSQAALEYLNRALPITIEVENAQEQARILYELGLVYNQLNKPDEALRNCQQALEIQRRLDEKHDLAQTLDVMAQVLDAQGKSEEALKTFQEALRMRRDVGDRIGLGYTLLNLSNFYEARGQNDSALSLLKESLKIQRDVGDQDTEALCLNNIGVNYADKGQYEDALTYFDQGLRLREKLKNSSGIADSNYAIADTLARFGQYDQALPHYLRALELWRSINDKRRAAFTSYGLGNLFEQQGRLGAALDAKAEALKTIREVQDRMGIAEMAGGYAESLSLLGRGEEAQKSLDEAVGLARENKNQNLLSQNLNFQGDSFFYRGDLAAAKSRYDQALQVASRATDRRLMLISKFNLAKVAVNEGRSREALGTLRTLAEQADTAGLQYLSVECSVYTGEALVNGKDYSQARQELNRALARSEKLGLLVLQARSHYFLAMSLRLAGTGSEAAHHYADTRRILDQINKEAKNDAFLRRTDIAPIYSESTKWSWNPPS
jgi:eukaryotic-like serine/threonine-protein kinase